MLSRFGLAVAALVIPGCASMEEGTMVEVTNSTPVVQAEPNVTVAVGFHVAAVKGPGGWEAVPMPPGEFVAAAKGGGVIVAVGTNVAAVTADGRTWEPVVIPPGRWRGVAFGTDRFVAVGENVAAISIDGRSWQKREIPAGSYRAVAWGSATFAAVGDAGKAAHSRDGGETWTGGVTVAGFNLGAVTWTGSRFASVGSTGAAAYSVDGDAWSAAPGLPVGLFYAVAAGPECLVAVGNGVAARALDGGAWSATPIPPGVYVGVAAIAGGFLALGWDSGVGLSSEAAVDGSAWTSRPFLPGPYWTAVVP